MKIKLLMLFVFGMINLYAIDTYKIELRYDQFAGECNGYLGGKVQKEFHGVSGAMKTQSKNEVLISLGENNADGGKQTFLIHSSSGFFSFWLKDKFNDQDFDVDLNKIENAKPTVKVFKNNHLIEEIKDIKGSGLTCKVFSLDVETGEIEKDIKFYSKSRLFIGQVIDAVTGKSIKDAHISIRSLGEETKKQISNEKGMFIAHVDVAKYEIIVEKKGYIENKTTAIMNIDEHPREMLIALSPETRKYRIVLTWGAKPYDLDAHLKGPHPSGGSFHISYQNRILIEGKDFLDRDDQKKYGPETITIYKPATGIYTYFVHNYSNKNWIRNKNLSRSNAIVQVYRENKLVQTFHVPEEEKGTYWNVFQINEAQEIVPINKIQTKLR